MKDLGFVIADSDEGIPLLFGDHVRVASAEEKKLWDELQRMQLCADAELAVVDHLQRRLEAADPTFKVIGRPSRTPTEGAQDAS